MSSAFFLGQASQVVLVVKNLPANAGDLRDVGLIPESWRPPGGGHGNALQYSFLENPMDRSLAGDSSWGYRIGHYWNELAHMHVSLVTSPYSRDTSLSFLESCSLWRRHLFLRLWFSSFSWEERSVECSGYVGLWDKRFVVTSSFPLPVNSLPHMYFVLFKPLSVCLWA